VRVSPGGLILNAFWIETTPPYLVRCRCTLLKTICRQRVTNPIDRAAIAAFILPSVCSSKTTSAAKGQLVAAQLCAGSVGSR